MSLPERKAVGSSYFNLVYIGVFVFYWTFLRCKDQQSNHVWDPSYLEYPSLQTLDAVNAIVFRVIATALDSKSTVLGFCDGICCFVRSISC